MARRRYLQEGFSATAAKEIPSFPRRCSLLLCSSHRSEEELQPWRSRVPSVAHAWARRRKKANGNCNSSETLARRSIEVQKQLHEQLEMQRKLQLQVEEQGWALQEMFEKQRDAMANIHRRNTLYSGDAANPSPGQGHPDTEEGSERNRGSPEDGRETERGDGNCE